MFIRGIKMVIGVKRINVRHSNRVPDHLSDQVRSRVPGHRNQVLAQVQDRHNQAQDQRNARVLSQARDLQLVRVINFNAIIKTEAEETQTTITTSTVVHRILTDRLRDLRHQELRQEVHRGGDK